MLIDKILPYIGPIMVYSILGSKQAVLEVNVFEAGKM